jgi:hypothetical protein
MGAVWFKYMGRECRLLQSSAFYSDVPFPDSWVFQWYFERLYEIAVNWRLLLVCGGSLRTLPTKVVVAWRIVVDELGNPTTSNRL